MSKILVVGSSNIDLVAEVKQLPLPGETIGDAKYSKFYGGKGANQAIAAVRAGGDVTFVTSVGKDAETFEMIEYFKKNGINTNFIRHSNSFSTGVALIMVDKNAENCIAVAPEANGELESKHIPDALLRNADLIVMQMEIPYETIKTIAQKAKQIGTRVLLNPAPARDLDKELLNCVDFLIVNETEAEFLSCLSLKNNGAEAILQNLFEKCNGPVIITCGENGVYFFDGTISQFFKSYSVDAFDTTGAGDTFCGVLAVEIAKEKDLGQAINHAMGAATIAITRFGAQTSIPTESEIKEFFKKTTFHKPTQIHETAP